MITIIDECTEGVYPYRWVNVLHYYKLLFWFSVIDECTEGVNPCLNGGTCVDRSPTEGFFECICPSQWAGPLCNNGKYSFYYTSPL